MPKRLFLVTLCLGLIGSLILSSPLVAKPNPPVSSAQPIQTRLPVTAETKDLLLQIATDKLCDPEGEMYCQPHTVFVNEGYAVVLASVQPTAGLFQIYKQVSKKNPQTAASWALIGTYQLIAYQESIEAAKLAKSLEAYFIKVIDDYHEKREQESD